MLLVADVSGVFTLIEDSVLVQTTTVADCRTSVIERTSTGFIAGCDDGKVAIFRCECKGHRDHHPRSPPEMSIFTSTRPRSLNRPLSLRRPPGKTQYVLIVTLNATTQLGGVRGIHVGPQDVTALLLCDEVPPLPPSASNPVSRHVESLECRCAPFL